MGSTSLGLERGKHLDWELGLSGSYCLPIVFNCILILCNDHRTILQSKDVYMNVVFYGKVCIWGYNLLS